MLAAVRNFLIAFLIAAIVFGSIAFAITGFIADNVIGIAESPDDTGSDTSAPDQQGIVTEPTDTTNPGPSYEDLNGDSFSVLLIGTDYRPEDFSDYIEDLSNDNASNAVIGILTKKIRTQNADFIMLANVYEETREIKLTLIPANTRVSINGNYRLLSSCYDKGGVEEIVNFVNYLTAVPIDYYIKANVTDAGKMLDVIDGVSLSLPSDIINPYYNPDRTADNAEYSGITGDRDFKTETAIKAGENVIDSSNLFALLHYRTANATASERADVMRALVKAVLKKAVSADYLNRALELFGKAIKYTDSNMGVSVLTDHIDFFTHFDEFKVTDIQYPGSEAMLGDEPCFVPNLSDAYELFRIGN